MYFIEWVLEIDKQHCQKKEKWRKVEINKKRAIVISAEERKMDRKTNGEIIIKKIYIQQLI